MKKLLLYMTTSVVALVVCASVSAQALRTAYFMENSTSRSFMNPALMPSRGYINIPGIGSTGVAYTSNALSLDNLLYPNPSGNGKLLTFLDESVSASDFLSTLKKRNTLDVDMNLNLIGFGFYSGKGFWTVDLSLRSNSNIGLPKAFFEFAKLGSGQTGGVYDLDNMVINATAYQETSVGYARPINDRLTVGARVKFLVGIGDFNMKFDRMHISMDDTEWKVDAQGSFNASVTGIEIDYKKDDNGNNTNVLDFDHIDVKPKGLSGMGFGVDLGATYKLLDNLTLSAGLVDLGLISWSSKNTISGVSSSSYNFPGFNIVDGADQGAADFGDLDDLTNFESTAGRSRTTSLRTTLNIGGEYTILDNLLAFGLLSSTQFRAVGAFTELTAAAVVRPCSWFSATASYSMVHSGFKTLGMAINFHPSWINFFVGTDYMICKTTPQYVPISQRAANVYLGLAVPLGKKPAKQFYKYQ